MDLKNFETMVGEIIRERGTCVIFDYNGHKDPTMSNMMEGKDYDNPSWISKQQRDRAILSDHIWTVTYDGGPDDDDGVPTAIYARGHDLPTVLADVLYRLGIPEMEDFINTTATIEAILEGNAIGPHAALMLSFGHTDKGMEPPAATTEEWFEGCGVKSTEFTSPEEWNKVLGNKRYWGLNWVGAGIADFARHAAKASGIEPLLEYLAEQNHTNIQQ